MGKYKQEIFKGYKDMKNIEGIKEFYKKTINKNPSAQIRTFFLKNYNQNFKGTTAIDLGCGAGNDTEFLISKGFNVTAIDTNEQVRSIFESRNLNSENLNIIIDDFSKIKLPKTDLVNAHFSLHYVEESFDGFMANLLQNVINPKGVFIGNFLGKEDEWKETFTTVEKEKLLEYFKDFNIFYFSEEKYYQDTARKKNKFWHVYTIIAQKIQTN